MKNLAAGVMVVVMVLAAAPASDAQTLFGGAGYALLWDDETFLGRGIAVSGGASYAVAEHVEIEGELSWARHVRDAGYLAAEGSPVAAAARIGYLFQRPQSRVRVFGSA